jgi:hypothetical protein
VTSKGKLGPVEEALIGTPVADAKQPLEVLRTVHSFDPCVACGVHVIDPDSNQVYKFKVICSVDDQRLVWATVSGCESVRTPAPPGFSRWRGDRFGRMPRSQYRCPL